MKIKKIIVLLLVLGLLVCSFGCGQSSNNESAEKAEKKPAEKEFISFASGPTVGFYYAMCGGIANILNTKTDNLEATVESTGAAVANCRLVSKGDCEFGITTADIGYYAYNGTEQFAEDGKDTYKNLRVVASLFPEAVQIVTMKDSGINNVSDMEGRKIAVGGAGSGTLVNAEMVLGLHGITFDDIEADYIGFGDASMALQDNNVDAAFVWAGVPSGAVLDLAALNEINLVSIDDDIIDKIIEKSPFYSVVEVPAASYNGMEKPATTVATQALLIASTDVDDDMVYEVLEKLFDNLDIMKASSARGGDVTLDSALDGVAFPLHPGAIKYYEENGLKIPDKLK